MSTLWACAMNRAWAAGCPITEFKHGQVEHLLMYLLHFFVLRISKMGLTTGFSSMKRWFKAVVVLARLPGSHSRVQSERNVVRFHFPSGRTHLLYDYGDSETLGKGLGILNIASEQKLPLPSSYVSWIFFLKLVFYLFNSFHLLVSSQMPTKAGAG